MNEVNRYRCLKIGAIIDREKIGNKVVKKINHDKDKDSKIILPPVVKKVNPKIKNNKIKSNIDELKEYSKSKGGLMIIHKNRIEEMLKDFTVEQLKRAIDSGTKWAEKNEVGRKNLSRSIVEHSIKNSQPKVAKYMTSEEYKKKFPGKQPVKTDKEVWF
jgi:gas vesicle protein